mmetsp:Transcript_33846/g.59685  ORF Transcript_33846/g.59685 Transcript_33846/m.59685 type:complete len:335 (-) Transcript_33846:141-1145(-)
MARFTCLFITCLVAFAQIGDSDSGVHNFGEYNDEVTLLQAAVEVKKKEAVASKAKATQQPVLDKEARYPELPREECSPTYSIMTHAEAPAGESARETVKVETSAKMESVETITSVVESDKMANDATDADVVPTSSAGSSLGWQVIVVAVCGLFFSALKARQDKASQTPAKHKVTDSAHQETWTMLLDAALAADEASFEGAFKRLSEEGMVNIDSWGCTALHFAAKGGSVPIVQRFLEHGLWVDSEDAWDETPLHIAARAGHVEVCKFLLSSGAGIDTLNAEDRTPLVVAGWAKHAAVCRFLLAEGAGVGGMPEEELPPMVSEMLELQATQDENN